MRKLSFVYYQVVYRFNKFKTKFDKQRGWWEWGGFVWSQVLGLGQFCLGLGQLCLGLVGAVLGQVKLVATPL